MKKIAILFLFCIGCVVTGAQTINEKDKAIVEKIKQNNLKYQTITSDLKQSRYVTILDEELYSEGTFFYKKPDQLAIEYKEGDAMIVNGEKFAMLIGGKLNETTAQANSKMGGLKAILTAFLEGDLMQPEATKITCFEDAHYYIFTVEIDENLIRGEIAQVVANYDKKNFSLSLLKIIETDDSYTIYELINKRFNNAIPEEKFNMTKRQME
ncbi:MAG: outer membrane lipoprotein carrier protein LolA [Bacteroidales bacterium]|jgi:outer membrane lipoprotein-sorting protein|nr:outer membrane lipoprotein carrier protein LolA [Bacteroidales bacterium]